MPNCHPVQSTVKQSTTSMHNTVVFGHLTAHNAWEQPGLSEWHDGSFQQQTNQMRWSVPGPSLPGSDSSISSRCPGKVKIIETIEMTRKTKVQLQYRLLSHGLALLATFWPEQSISIDGTSGVAECDAPLSGGHGPRAGS